MTDRLDPIVRPGGWPRLTLGVALCAAAALAACALCAGDIAGFDTLGPAAFAALVFATVFLLPILLFLCVAVAVAGADLIRKATR